MRGWMAAAGAGLTSLVLLAVLSSAAATLIVDGGVLQIFTHPVHIEVPTEPSDLDCVSTGIFSRQLQWQPSALADSYRIYHDGPFWDDDFKLLDQVSAPATTYDKVWPSFFRHRWYVTTVSGSWESGPSNVIEVHCRPALSFPGPWGLDGENEHSQRIVTLSWEPAAAAALYGVFRAEQSGGPYDMAGTTESTTYEDGAVAEGVTYYYVVVAVDAQGNESDPSPEIAVPDTAPTPSPTPIATGTAEPTSTAGPGPSPTAQPEATPTAEPRVTATPADAETLTPEATTTPTPTTEPTATSGAGG